MAVIKLLMKPNVVKKRTKKFIRHESNWYVKIKHNWQKLRDTENRGHRGFKGQTLTSKTACGSSKKTKHMRPSGFWKILVSLMCNTIHCTESAHSVFSKNHRNTIARTAQLAIRVANPTPGCAAKKMN
uniref:60S ribosomal protein L32 n=1 Tax=Mustela putorius furo TaxID=9669 RepID=M3Z640_MUSPF